MLWCACWVAKTFTDLPHEYQAFIRFMCLHYYLSDFAFDVALGYPEQVQFIVLHWAHKRLQWIIIFRVGVLEKVALCLLTTRTTTLRRTHLFAPQNNLPLGQPCHIPFIGTQSSKWASQHPSVKGWFVICLHARNQRISSPEHLLLCQESRIAHFVTVFCLLWWQGPRQLNHSTTCLVKFLLIVKQQPLHFLPMHNWKLLFQQVNSRRFAQTTTELTCCWHSGLTGTFWTPLDMQV